MLWRGFDPVVVGSVGHSLLSVTSDLHNVGVGLCVFVAPMLRLKTTGNVIHAVGQ